MNNFIKSTLAALIILKFTFGYAQLPPTVDKVVQLSTFEVNLHPEKFVAAYNKAYRDETNEIYKRQESNPYYRLTEKEGSHLENDLYTRLTSPELKPEKMYHFEIPLEIVGVDFAERISPKIKESLIFIKNGKSFVRWILNPGSRRNNDFSYEADVSGPNREILEKKGMHYGLKIQRYLESKGLDSTVYSRYIGYRTASRSFLIRDSKTGAAFITKTSTTQAPGKWSIAKYLTSEEAHDTRIYADYLNEKNKENPFQNFTIMDEPGSLSLKTDRHWETEPISAEESLFYKSDRELVDDAILIRDIDPILAKNGKIYIPLFSVFASYGKMIANKNGEENVEKYWTEHGLKVAAKGLAELAIKTGLQHDSPHSQNFLIEVDENYKPTGRLVIRDLSDFYIDKNILYAVTSKASKIIDSLYDKSNVHDYTTAHFTPFRGNSYPDWMTGYVKAKLWNILFLETYNQEILKLTGAQPGAMIKEVKLNDKNDEYFQYTFSEEILRKLKNSALKHISCERLFE